MARFFAVLALLALGWLAGAWTLMLLVGVVHAEWLPQLPTIGFNASMIVSLLLMVRAFAVAIPTEFMKAVNGGDR